MSCSIGSFTMARAASWAVMILTISYPEFFKDVWAYIPCNGLVKNTDLRKSVITLWCGDPYLSRLDVTNLGIHSSFLFVSNRDSSEHSTAIHIYSSARDVPPACLLVASTVQIYTAIMQPTWDLPSKQATPWPIVPLAY
ncbi:hypothetical protein EDD15DRAFT_936004 [Pisolithus albus]|nr:hypothetical protein EDD15DRAFT_936004 [Pisolithus albus]